MKNYVVIVTSTACFLSSWLTSSDPSCPFPILCQLNLTTLIQGHLAAVFQGDLVQNLAKECVLIFDGEQIRIEHVQSSAVGLRDTISSQDANHTRRMHTIQGAGGAGAGCSITPPTMKPMAEYPAKLTNMKKRGRHLEVIPTPLNEVAIEVKSSVSTIANKEIEESNSENAIHPTTNVEFNQSRQEQRGGVATETGMDYLHQNIRKPPADPLPLPSREETCPESFRAPVKLTFNKRLRPQLNNLFSNSIGPTISPPPVPPSEVYSTPAMEEAITTVGGMAQVNVVNNGRGSPTDQMDWSKSRPSSTQWIGLPDRQTLSSPPPIPVHSIIPPLEENSEDECDSDDSDSSN